MSHPAPLRSVATATSRGTTTPPRPARTTRGAVGTRDASSSAALLERLEREWQHTRACHDAMAREWAHAIPALEGCTGLDEVVLACRDDNDAALLALVLRAQRGCPVAGRTVLRVLTPLLQGLARHDPRADLGDYLGACWPVLMQRSAERSHGVLAGLALDTRRMLVRERAGLWALPTPEPDLVASSPRVVASAMDAGPQYPADADLDARGVLDAAGRLRLLPEPSREVMASVYLDGLSGADAARRHRTSADMVRYRCSSGVRMLRAHRGELLDDLLA